MSRHFSNGVIAAICALAFLFLIRLTWAPDPTQSLFFRAGQLENAGQSALALRAYALISDQHPDSFYAPRALLRQGDMLAEQGIRLGDKRSLQDAVAFYARLSVTYPRDALVTEALLAAGQIALKNLGDRAAAKNFYSQLLEKSGAKSDVAATATLKLGSIAVEEGDGKLAQTLLQRVLQRWPNLSDRGAEAQFLLGVTYETLFKNPEWAKNAYNATIERYPNSSWASSALQKLGVSVFNGTRKRPARRVLIQIDALPDNGQSNGSLWSALRLVLAAHGTEISETTLGGWSLAPFYGGFDPANPGRVAPWEIDAWENVIANAGLRFSVQSGGKAPDALRGLQDEIDSARAPLVYFEEKGAKVWALCVGYDSERGEVMLQSRGARFDTLSAKSFAALWSAKSSFGQPFTLISLVPNDQKTRPKPSLTPTPIPSAAPAFLSATGNGNISQLAAPGQQNAPAFVWQLPVISLKTGDARARERAATIMSRTRNEKVLMGASGLDRLATEMGRIARARPAPIANESAPSIPSPTPVETPTSPSPLPESESPYVPDATPTPLPTPAPRRQLVRIILRDDEKRARALLQFLESPAQSWAQSRREAAAWCDEASRRSKDPAWQRARDALRESARALESAISLAPAALSSPLGSGDRLQIGEAAREIERAAAAERNAQRALAR